MSELQPLQQPLSRVTNIPVVTAGVTATEVTTGVTTTEVTRPVQLSRPPIQINDDQSDEYDSEYETDEEYYEIDEGEYRAPVVQTKGDVAISEHTRAVLRDPCEVLMCGNVTLETLGWRFKVNHLEHLRSIEVAQGVADAAQQSSRSAAARVKQPTVKSTIKGYLAAIPLINKTSFGNIEEEEEDLDANIEPQFSNSPHLQTSALQPVDNHRNNTRSVFHTRREASDMWRLMVDTAAPYGLAYLYSWAKWQTVTGSGAINERFNQLSVFQGQADPIVRPSFALKGLTAKLRNTNLRQAILDRIKTESVSVMFPTLLGFWKWPIVGRHLAWWPPLEHCSTQNLLANNATLWRLFSVTPDSINITDLLVLFDLPLPPIAKAPSIISLDSKEVIVPNAPSYNQKEARRWLKYLDYHPSLHFEVGCRRFPVSVLVQPPYNLTWLDIRKKMRYIEIFNWEGFFSLVEMQQLGFSFQTELEMSQTGNKRCLDASIFRVMAEKGGWRYLDLVQCTDFTPAIAKVLRLTQADMLNLQWFPIEQVEEKGREEGRPNSDKETKLAAEVTKTKSEWMSQEFFFSLAKRSKREIVDMVINEEDSKRSKNKKHKKKKKNNKHKRTEEEELSDNSDG